MAATKQHKVTAASSASGQSVDKAARSPALLANSNQTVAGRRTGPANLAALPPSPRLAVRLKQLIKPATTWLDEHIDPRMRGLIMLNAMTILMGSNWVVVKQSNAAFDPFVFAALRFALAAAAFVPFLNKGLKSKQISRAGAEIGIWMALGYITQAWALEFTPASRASLLSTFTVLGVPALAGLSGQKIKPLVWGCGLLALVGTGLLEQGGGVPPNVGDAISIVSAFFFAVQIFRTEKISRALPKDSALPLMAVAMLTTAGISATNAAVVHWEDAAAAASALSQLVVAGVGGSSHHAASALWELLYTAWCSTDMVLFLELLALQHVSSTEAAMIYSMEPLSGALMAYAFLGERWGTAGWMGAGVILVASLATQLTGAVEEEAETAGE